MHALVCPWNDRSAKTANTFGGAFERRNNHLLRLAIPYREMMNGDHP